MSNVNVTQLTIKNDPETAEKIRKLYEELAEKRRERQLAQQRARILYEEELVRRALEPVLVEQPQPTGDPLHDMFARSEAERKAERTRQNNAGVLYADRHGLPPSMFVRY
jgi:hypothetical protein